jgi:hypothetical protein
MKYTLCQWEDNGYHDSYFYAGIWDTETKKMSAMMTGATAFCGGVEPPPAIDDYSDLVEAMAVLKLEI